MMKVNLYDFCMSSFQVKEFQCHVWTINKATEEETCEHFTINDKVHDKLWDYRDTEVAQFKCLKRNTIDIIAMRYVE